MERFGPYVLEAELGRGPSGVVHRARDTGHGDRVVALKIVDARLSADPAFRERFRRDVDVLGAVREPHVVPVHAVGEIGGRLFVDMRLVRGESLAAVLARGPLEPERARVVTEQLMSTRAALARGGYPPRPIAPEDVLLTGAPGRPEFVQLVGLGLGRLPVDPATLTAPAALVSGNGRQGGRFRSRALVVALVVAVAVVAALLLVPRGPGGPPGLLARIPAVDGNPRAAALATLDGEPVVLTVGGDGQVRTWSVDGSELRPPIDADAVRITGVPGRSLVAVLRPDDTYRFHDLDTGAPVGEPFGTAVGGGDVTAESLLAAPGADPPVLVAREEVDLVEGVRAYGVPDGQALGDAVRGIGEVTSGVPLAVDGRTLVPSVTGAGAVRFRDAVTGRQIGTPTAPLPARVVFVIGALRGGVPVAVVACSDNTLRVLDMATGEPVGEPLAGPTEPADVVVSIPLGDRTLVAAATASDTWVWDLADGAPVARFADHPLAGGVADAAADGDDALLVGLDELRTGFTVWEASRALTGGIAP